MWKKIHSNRDPRDTLYSELRKEFSGYFDRAFTWFRYVVNAHPEVSFGSMIILLVGSAILSFTVFRHRDVKIPEAYPVHTIKNPVETGFSQIMQVSGKIRKTLNLKKVVDSLSAKKSLTAADSLTLGDALDSLQSLKLKPRVPRKP